MEIITENENFALIFDKFSSLLGDDLQAYSGHCYRMLNYMNYWGLEEDELHVASIALPFHDIGVWTHNTMDYLEVSFLEARKYIRMNKIEVDEEAVESMILGHHKIRSIRENDLSEKTRKADLVDLSFGMLSFGIPGKQMKAIKKAFPYAGFQKSIYGRVMGYAFRHPGNPFPMMKF